MGGGGGNSPLFCWSAWTVAYCELRNLGPCAWLLPSLSSTGLSTSHPLSEVLSVPIARGGRFYCSGGSVSASGVGSILSRREGPRSHCFAELSITAVSREFRVLSWSVVNPRSVQHCPLARPRCLGQPPPGKGSHPWCPASLPLLGSPGKGWHSTGQLSQELLGT